MAENLSLNPWKWRPDSSTSVGASYTEAGLNLGGSGSPFVPADKDSLPLGMEKVKYQPTVSNYATRFRIYIAQGDGVTSIVPGDPIFVFRGHRPRRVQEDQVLALNAEGVNYMLRLYSDPSKPDPTFRFYEQEECEKWQFAGYVQKELGQPYQHLLDNLTRCRVFNLMVHHGGLDDIRARNIWRNMPRVECGTPLYFILKKVVLFNELFHPDTKQRVSPANPKPIPCFQLVPYADYNMQYPPRPLRDSYFVDRDTGTCEKVSGSVIYAGTLYRKNGSRFNLDPTSMSAKTISSLSTCPYNVYGDYYEPIPDNIGDFVLTVVL